MQGSPLWTDTNQGSSLAATPLGTVPHSPPCRTEERGHGKRKASCQMREANLCIHTHREHKAGKPLALFLLRVSSVF